MGRTFEYREIRISLEKGDRVLHKVLRDDGLQMATCPTDTAAQTMAIMLNAQATNRKGNAHDIRSDTHIPKDVRHVVMRAWELYDHGGYFVFRAVSRKLYPGSWACKGRQALVKNFGKEFHPEQRKHLTFTVEYHPSFLSVHRWDGKVGRMSTEGFRC